MDQNLHLLYEIFIPFAFSLHGFSLCSCMGRQCSLTLATIIASTTKAITVQQKFLAFLAWIVLDNRIALDYLLAKQGVCAVVTQH